MRIERQGGTAKAVVDYERQAREQRAGLPSEQEPVPTPVPRSHQASNGRAPLRRRGAMKPAEGFDALLRTSPRLAAVQAVRESEAGYSRSSSGSSSVHDRYD